MDLIQFCTVPSSGIELTKTTLVQNNDTTVGYKQSLWELRTPMLIQKKNMDRTRLHIRTDRQGDSYIHPKLCLEGGILFHAIRDSS